MAVGVVVTALAVSIVLMVLLAVSGLIVPTAIRDRTLPRTFAQVVELVAYVLMVGGTTSAVVVSAVSSVAQVSGISRASECLFLFGAIGAIFWSTSGAKGDGRRDGGR